MCAIIVIALVGTSYLAVYFTRRARADLERMLVPLAELIDGKVDLDEAEIKGHCQGNLVMGRMANAAAGTVRLFQIDMIDAAGGVGWNYVYSRPRKDHSAPEIEFISDRPGIQAALPSLQEARLGPLQPNDRDWMQLEYNPEAGHIRLARPLKGRTEIPTPERFRDDLAYLVSLCAENRDYQERHRGADVEAGA
jgi:hypothetical protein